MVLLFLWLILYTETFVKSINWVGLMRCFFFPPLLANRYLLYIVTQKMIEMGNCGLLAGSLLQGEPVATSRKKNYLSTYEHKEKLVLQ